MNYSFNEDRSALELFHSGDAVHAYDLLGAHLVEQDGKSGAVFRVWAPNAVQVSVIGDFNDWNDTANLMYKISDGVWELFIEGVHEYDAYKYCLETHEHQMIFKADPYAFHAQTRPGNASLVYNLEGYRWNDSKWFETRKDRDISSAPMNIYEMHLGSWRRNQNGEFLSYGILADELVAYLKEMHYTHVQFMPLMEYPYDPSWGFQTTGYFAATSRYGTPGDLMFLIDRLHCENIGVIMDWVPSNFPKDEHGLARFDGTCLYESEDPRVGERPAWGTCLFNFSRYEVTSFLVSSAMFWLDKYHIDGIRVGALSSMLFLDYGKQEGEWIPNRYGGKENLETIDFIKHLNTAVHMYHPDIMMFAEENTSWPKLTHKIEEGGLGFDFKWNMGWMNDMLHYMSLNPMWRPFNHDSLTFSFFYAFAERFLLPISHDEVSHGKGSLIAKMPGRPEEQFAGVRAFITYMYAHPGKKLAFMGSEIGQFEEWDSDSQLRWDLLGNQKHAKLREFFKAINEFYLENKPLYELDAVWKGFDWIHHDDYTNSVIAFKRTDLSGNEIVAVCNFQPIARECYTIGVPKYGLYDEVFTSDEARFGGTGVSNGKGIKPKRMKIHGCDQGITVTLPPMGVIYLKCSQELFEENE